MSVARALPRADLIGIARKVGKGLARIAVQGAVQHIGALVKNILSAVAVVKIHIQNRDPPMTLIAQILSRDGRVIQEAVPSEHIVRRVMPRGSA
jgi:hypothetical protein